MRSVLKCNIVTLYVFNIKLILVLVLGYNKFKLIKLDIIENCNRLNDLLKPHK